MPQLPLDHNERNAFVSHLDRVRVPQLVWGKPAPDACPGGSAMQLFARGRRLPVASGRRSVDHAQQRADRKLAADLEPRIELLPRPTIHPDLTALAARPAPDEHGAAGPVEVALLERERFADP